LLSGDAPMRLVSASLIEAGGDISFPTVWRASPAHAGVDRNCNVSAENPAAAGQCSMGTIFVELKN
jgi:hypothetical protein